MPRGPDRNTSYGQSGRKFLLTAFTLLSGIFMFLFTTNSTQALALGHSSATASAVRGFSFLRLCLWSLWSALRAPEVPGTP